MKEEIIRALLEQKEIFGDDLFEEAKLTSPKNTAGRRTTLIENTSLPSAADKNEEQSGNLFTEDWTKSDTIVELNKLICTCLKCPLGSTRKNFVFGSGNPDAD